MTSCRFRSAGSGGLGYNLGGCVSRGGWICSAVTRTVLTSAP
nr:MAG TPA: hypothetical protein [Bacteriophage sp.]